MLYFQIAGETYNAGFPNLKTIDVLGMDNYLLGQGTVLYVIRCLGASLASILTNQKCLQILANSSGRVKLPSVKNHCSSPFW